MPLTPAEKQARYRERLRARTVTSEDDLRPDLVTEEEEPVTEDEGPTVVFEGKLYAQVKFPHLSEEEYVTQALARPDLFDRDRAERYAHWRYAGFCGGQIAGL
jgi:hypothetical protein